MFDLIPHIEKRLVVPLGTTSYITHFVFSQWQSPSQVEVPPLIEVGVLQLVDKLIKENAL